MKKIKGESEQQDLCFYCLKTFNLNLTLNFLFRVIDFVLFVLILVLVK